MEPDVFDQVTGHLIISINTETGDRYFNYHCSIFKFPIYFQQVPWHPQALAEASQHPELKAALRSLPPRGTPLRGLLRTSPTTQATIS